jgi:hypothetical protein
MCIHVPSALIREVNYWRKKGLTNVAGITLTSSDSGRFLGSWLCFADQPDSIAQAVHALRTWHPGNHWIDFELVNAWRWRHDLSQIMDETKLPAPPPLFTVEPMPDDDTPAHTRAMVKRWLDAAKDAAYGRA